jgi:hypothetical protein
MLDDFKTELQRLGGTNLERDNMAQRDMGRPPSPRPLPRIVEKSQDDHIEEADALDPDDEREWQWLEINPPKPIHQPFCVSRSLP